jgi:hypothetical protein
VANQDEDERRTDLIDLSLLDDVVGIGAREAGRLEQVHHLGPGANVVIAKNCVAGKLKIQLSKHKK